MVVDVVDVVVDVVDVSVDVAVEVAQDPKTSDVTIRQISNTQINPFFMQFSYFI